MKSLYVIMLCVLFFYTEPLPAQDMEFFEFSPLTEAICPNGEPFMQSMDWEVYHTLDNTWLGERDTSYCLDVLESYYLDITSDSYAPGRPIFLRYTGDSLLLMENTLYALQVYEGSEAQDLDLENDNYCYESFCQGLMVGVEIPAHPEDTVNSTNMRWHHTAFKDEFSYFLEIPGYQSLCFPTERFVDGNILREIIFKIIPQDGADIYLSDFSLVHNYGNQTIPGSGEPYFYENMGGLNMEYEGPTGTLVLHTDTAYPDADHQSYFDLYPNPNTDTISDLQLELSEGTSLVYQPFSNLRGGLIEGSDSLRHTVSYVNNGGGICFVAYIDVIIKANESFEHRSGDLVFIGTDACMQFRPHSKLKVAKDAQMIVGHDPTGILLLSNDVEIVLERHASLVINNYLTLNYLEEGEDENVHIYLEPTKALLFGAGSSVRDWSYGVTKLHVHLRGGLLDVSELSAESLANIVVLDERPAVASQEISILGNPVTDELLFGWESLKDDRQTISIYTAAGGLVMEWQKEVFAGLNYESVHLKGLLSGIYLLDIRGAKMKWTSSFLMQ